MGKFNNKLKSSKNYLRNVKNDLSRSLILTRYRIGSLKIKILNFKLRKNLNKKKQITLSPEQLKEKYENILTKNFSLIDLYTFNDKAPLVTIIIVNRNGSNHLKRLFKDFKENIQYPSFEIIIVDNDSTDDSINYLEKLSDSLPITIIKNTQNKSFSIANNQAANIAKGEYLLLLNNDVKPLYGWLNQMMQTALKSGDIGAVGAKLIYPDCSTSVHNKNNSFKVQHRGIAFKKEDGFIKPYNLVDNEPYGSDNSLEQERAAVTAASMLVKKDIYWEVNGLDERYNYGYEDVDFCLKLIKRGYKNIYCPKASLFHYEFGTQEKNNSGKIMKWRFFNMRLFNKEWKGWLEICLLIDKIDNNKLFSEKHLKIVFIISESGKSASAGDYFTALEFGESLKKLGYDISFLTRKGPVDWYKVDEDVDVLISLLDVYNPKKIKCTNKSLIKIAWPRNWFDRWVSNPGFLEYDIIFAPSKTACNYIKEKTNREIFLLSIATNPSKFNSKVQPNEELISDYCFTGSYWNDPRDIIEMLEPDDLPYTFNLYGKNWDKISKFKDYNKGFLVYSKLPEVYKSTKIVIDDANRVTKEYGSVNSRVYDALACGTLVLTNGKIGSEETFKSKLPVFRSKEELSELITYYLENEKVRLSKVRELQKFVLENHVYDNRSEKLKQTLKKHILKTRIAIKIPAPNWKTVYEWGDYNLALGLKKEFEKKNCDVLLQILPEWDSEEDIEYNVVLVLRGLSQYKPKKQHFNIMWNISHPDKVTVEEYNEYDYVLIASEFWANKIREKVDVPVDEMLQCTDPEVFYPDYSEKYKNELLFVGNSRKVLRKIIKDLLPTDMDLSVYGTNWKGLIDKKYIKGEHIPNGELRKAYSSCEILLNDHWDDMREKGFISNRLFDGLASGSFIISDKVKGAENVFNDALITYDTPEELEDIIKEVITKDKEMKMSDEYRNIVLKNHTFKNRTEQILRIINSNNN
ncbi:glycosyltransferase [Methanobacterium sp. SMA-27]|uniref:glycosyltransferase family protein n=1 Tax=Methanobacterium sp. SMA-27 TaxID=1495336 RepID=UPI000693A75B|nr:glycosyltransferase [Methanobacterium sp. SMA-27]